MVSSTKVMCRAPYLDAQVLGGNFGGQGYWKPEIQTNGHLPWVFHRSGVSLHNRHPSKEHHSKGNLQFSSFVVHFSKIIDVPWLFGGAGMSNYQGKEFLNDQKVRKVQRVAKT